MAVGDAPSLALLSHADSPKTTAETISLHQGIYAAIDGPMFRFCDGERNRTYAGYACGLNRFRLLYPERSIDIRSTDPSDGSTLFVDQGVARFVRGTSVPGTATFAVQLYPTLVFDSNVIQGLSDRDNNSRAAVGMLADGSVFFAIHPSISMPAFAELLKRKGAVFAGYTDGGGSTALYVDTNVDGSAEYSFNIRGRRVVSWITMERKSTTDKVINRVVDGIVALTGPSKGVGIGLLVASLTIGAAVFALRR